MSVATKKALATSLKSLMGIKSLEKITIKDVVSHCGVNRQTFYYHFKDIYDLLGWIYKIEAVESIANYRTYETWQQGFLKIFQYVQANRKICMNTLHSLGREHLEGFLRDEIFNILMGVVNERAQGHEISLEDKSFIANFYTYAFIGLLLEWMRSGLKENPEKIVERLSVLIDGDMEKVIKKYTKG